MTDACRRLLPMRTGKQGQLCEWPYDWDADAVERNHRHVSHLYGLYPSRQIDLEETPDLAAAARRSLELRGDEATGWATAWRINLWARLRDARARAPHPALPARARTNISQHVRRPSPVPDRRQFRRDRGHRRNAGAAATREHRPAACPFPPAWPSGSITGLRMRGGLGLDLSWRHGMLEVAHLRTAQPARQVLRYRGKATEVRIDPGRPLRLTPRDFGDRPTGGGIRGIDGLICQTKMSKNPGRKRWRTAGGAR